MSIMTIALLSVFAIAAPVADADATPFAGADQILSGGAACELPILWRIAEVDPRFGISEDEAAQAVRRAGMLWESAADQILMFQESSDGIPIRFVYDERQEAAEARREQMALIDERLVAIEEAEARLRGLDSQLARRRIVHDARLTSFQDRLASHQEMVEYWNQRGGAPPDEAIRLRENEEELNAARLAANEAAEEVNAAVDELNRATDALNRQIQETNRARAELEERFPAMRVQSGQYYESRSGLGRFTLSRELEIRIFHFESEEHLSLVIAHELGHAIGIEHTGVEGSLMAEASVAGPDQAAPSLHPADLEALRAICPEM